MTHSMTADKLAALTAARELVSRNLLALEDDPLRADVIVNGSGFCYLVRFWTLTGVLDTSSFGYRLRVDGLLGAARARRRVADEWIHAGAPVEWARAEADSAVDALVAYTSGTAWGTA